MYIGVWYWIFLRPDWTLVVIRDAKQGELSHMRAWADQVAPQVAAHYGIDVGRIREAYAGFPRGRVVLRGDIYVFYHGDDHPKDRDRAEKLTPSRFKLNLKAAQGKTRFEFDEHETMLPDDQDILRQVIGPIPYDWKQEGPR